jgi:large subunit ribosomal protein L1
MAAKKSKEKPTATEPTPESKKTKTKKRAVTTEKHSKRYQFISKSIEKKAYSLDEAISLVKKNANAKFDETIEAHFRLGVDPTQTSESVRGSVQLPHGTGKSVRTLVFASGSNAETAKKSGATVATDAIVTQIEKGSIPFDLVIATPEEMPKIAKLARVLGVRGLMPNPRSGTVTQDVDSVIEARRQGLVDFKNDQAALHLTLGKASFTEKALKANFLVLLTAVRSARPAKTSGDYLKAVTLTSTMGVGVKVDLSSLN